MKIELCDIHKSFGPVKANDGISLTVESGTIHGLLGENGAGKTTLMKVLSGYIPCDAGRILLDGQEVRFSSPAEAIALGIGMLHQDPLDVPPISVLDNFLLGRRGGLLLDAREGRRQLAELCQRFGFQLYLCFLQQQFRFVADSSSFGSGFQFQVRKVLFGTLFKPKIAIRASVIFILP